MFDYIRSLRNDLITHRFAIIVISIFLGASTAGWIITEFIPPNFPNRREMFREMWGDTAVRMIGFFQLYDPFHSVWYRAVLALFFVTLLLCMLTRWKSLIMRSFRIDPPRGVGDLEKKKQRLEISLGDLKKGGSASREPIDAERVRYLFQRIAALFRKKGYYVVADGNNEEILFTAVAGRWRFLGGFLFHVGLVVLVLGGMIGSFWGKTEVLYGKAGDVLPLHGSPYSLLVEDFEILTTEKDELLNYRSKVHILDGAGDTLRAAEIKVNSPLKFRAFIVYQSSYYAAEHDFTSAHIEFILEGKSRKSHVTISPHNKFELEGTSFTLEAKRFFPDFKMAAEGPYSASRNMANPALEIEVRGPEMAERGWLFLKFPQFNSLSKVPLRFNLLNLEPAYYTGLQISTNPGTQTILAGIIFATVGLILLYTFSYRSIKGLVSNEQLVLAGVRYNWKVSFENEFKELGKAVRKELSDIINREGNLS